MWSLPGPMAMQPELPTSDAPNSQAQLSWELGWQSGISEGDPETHLRRSILPQRPLQVLRARLDGRDRPVRRVEHVEQFRDAFERDAVRQRDLLLNAQVGLAPRRLHEAVPRDDGAIGARAEAAGRLGSADARDVAHVGAVSRD